MPALTTDLFNKGTNNFSTTLSAGIGASDTTISLASATNLPTDTGIVLCIDRVDANGNKTPSAREYVKGVISGTTLTNVTRGVGGSSGLTHSIGAVVEYIFDQVSWNDMVQGVTAQHNQDGTHAAITATSITDNGTLLSSERLETYFDHVNSGCVWSGLGYGTTLTAAMTAGVVYINGQRLVVGSVATRTFTASKDTYIDILNTAGVGSLVYTEVANNAASPALAANSVRIGIVVSGANIAAATSINQGQETMVLPIVSSVPYAVTDSLGNLICPRDPNRKVLGYKQILTNYSISSTAVNPVTGLSAPVIVPAGRKAKVTFGAGSVSQATLNDYTFISLWSGTVGSGTQLASSDFRAVVANDQKPMSLTVVNTPATSSVTYNVGAKFGTTGGGQVTAATGEPAYIIVELI